MTQHYIVTGLLQGANLRAAPSKTGQELGNLKFADLVEETGPPSERWKQVRVLDGALAGQSGFVSDINLAAPRSDAVTRLIKSAAHYWRMFDFGRGRAGVEPYRQHVLDMWSQLGSRPPGGNVLHKKWPWSAAGMSAMIRHAGGYDGFKYAEGHSEFIRHSIAQRDQNRPAGPFWGYDLHEAAPEVGDLVVQYRNTVQTMESVRAGTGFFPSHTDVVVRVEANRCYAIGANVRVVRSPAPGAGNTLGHKILPIDPDTGQLKREQRVFMLMKNRL